MRRRKQWSLARQLLVFQAVLVMVLVIGGAIVASIDIAERERRASADMVSALAITLADTPAVVSAVTGPRPTEQLQPLAERVRQDTHVDFITIMSPTGLRFTHPNIGAIGQQFRGNIAKAQRGEPFTETYAGTLGPSVRAVVPIFNADREVVGMVSAGIKMTAISEQVTERVIGLTLVSLVALLIGAAGTYLVSRRLRRQTGGLAPNELARMIEYHESILHAVREGLMLVGQDYRVTMCNDGVRTLLDLPPDAEGKLVNELDLPPGLVDRLLTGTEMRDELHLTDTRVLVVNSSTVRFDGRARGTVVTIRDRTDLQALTGELDTMRGFAESLRSHAHEAANRLHTVVSLVELGRPQEAVDFATGELEIAQRLTDRVVASVSEPVVAALLLGKAADASERGVELVISPDTEVADDDLGALPARDLVTILGNLVDNAVDAAVDAADRRRPAVWVSARADAKGLVLRVSDTGDGLPEDALEDAFRRGWSTKSGSRGLGLALVGQAVRRLGGTIEVGRDIGAVFTVRLPSGGRA